MIEKLDFDWGHRCVQNTERAPVDWYATAREWPAPTDLPWDYA